MGFGSKTVVGEVWLLVVFKVIHRRNQLNEWFASFEKAPSGFRFHIYYFKPLQLDPWGFPGLPGGVFFSKLPFPSWDKCLFFSHIHHAPPTSAPPHSESPGQPAVTWGPGAWWGAFSWEQRLAGCPLPHACLRHGKPGGLSWRIGGVCWKLSVLRGKGTFSWISRSKSINQLQRNTREGGSGFLAGIEITKAAGSLWGFCPSWCRGQNSGAIPG